MLVEWVLKQIITNNYFHFLKIFFFAKNGFLLELEVKMDFVLKFNPVFTENVICFLNIK